MIAPVNKRRFLDVTAGDVNRDRRRSFHGRIVCLTLVLGIYLGLNASAITLGTRTQIAYGILLIVLVPLAIDGLITSRKTLDPTPPILALWTAWAFVILVLHPVLHPQSLASAITDFVVIISPALFFWAYRPIVGSAKIVMAHLVALCIASGVATAIAWQISGGARFEAPSTLLLTIPWVVLLTRLSLRPLYRLASGVAVVFALGATFASRFRTSLILWTVSALYAWLLPRMNRKGAPQLLAVAIVATIMIALFSPAILENDRVQELASRIRLDTLVSGSADTSLDSRLAEVQDALLTMSNLRDPTVYLTGMGHGSGYQPYYSTISQNLDASSGTVHNIHVTPVMILFRYGVLGFLLFLGLVAAALHYSYRACRTRPSMYSVTIFIIMLASTMDMMVRNATANPLFSLAIALSFLQRNHKDEPAKATEGTGT